VVKIQESGRPIEKLGKKSNNKKSLNQGRKNTFIFKGDAREEESGKASLNNCRAKKKREGLIPSREKSRHQSGEKKDSDG